MDNLDKILGGNEFKEVLDSVAKVRKTVKSLMKDTLTDEVRSLINPEHLKLIDKSGKINDMSADALHSHIKDLEKILPETDSKKQ